MLPLSYLHLFSCIPCSALGGKLPVPPPSCDISVQDVKVHSRLAHRRSGDEWCWNMCSSTWTMVPFQVSLVLCVSRHRAELWELKFKWLFSSSVVETYVSGGYSWSRSIGSWTAGGWQLKMLVGCPCQTSGAGYQAALAVHILIMKQGQSTSIGLPSPWASSLRALAWASCHFHTRSRTGIDVTGH